MYIKEIVKRKLLKKRNIIIDKNSNINYNVCQTSSNQATIINDSNVHISKMGEGCFIEHCFAYGDIELGKNVSISGPGTVLHSECGRIVIGNYTSIAPNVTITEFNHDITRPSTYAFNYNFWKESLNKDVVSKGDIVIGEDVWIGSNVSILSGVTIGRGAVIGAGAVVTKNIEPYSIVGGVPAKLIKMRFMQDKIKEIESLKWWEWDYNKIMKNKEFFDNPV